MTTKEISDIVNRYENDQSRMMDILLDIHHKWRFLDDDKLKLLSEAMAISEIEVLDTLTFYHFFHRKNPGRITIHVDNSIVAKMFGQEDVLKTFEQELGIKCGEVDDKGDFGLFETPCIGKSDQAPAALINFVPFTRLTHQKIKTIVEQLKLGKQPESIALQFEDINQYNQINNTNQNSVFHRPIESGCALKSAIGKNPEDLLKTIKESGLRGRGGAGFSTGTKWQMCSDIKSEKKYIVCNADEGEPGTFKDRALLSNYAYQVIEGMTIAAWIVGADEGIIYLRAEYTYLKQQLITLIDELNQKQLLGQSILGNPGFDFRVRIQMGAGSYVCGEESALLESMEGKRGEPRIRPPFPIESGYHGKPTVINNVETFCSIPKIIEKGAQWFNLMGQKQSTGTRLISVSGDCDNPGIYEIEWGMSIAELINMVKAKDAMALQIGGPSGILIKAQDANRQLSFDDLPTGGSVIIFNHKRDLLTVVKNFMTFFVNESCGCCTPCRAGNVVLEKLVDQFIDKTASHEDLEHIKSWSHIIKSTSRCGLGQTSSQPILTTYQAFPELFTSAINPEHNEMFHQFDVEKATRDYDEAIKMEIK